MGARGAVSGDDQTRKIALHRAGAVGCGDCLGGGVMKLPKERVVEIMAGERA